MKIPKMEHLSKESFVQLLTFIINEIGIKKIHFSQKEPMRKESLLLNVFSLEIPLSGKKHILYTNGGNMKDVYLSPGEIHCAPAIHWKKPLWDSIHKMTSILYAPDYIRITYIDYNKLSPYYETHPAQTFYHTSIPLDITGKGILKVLALMADSGEETGSEKLLESLLQITLKTLKNDTVSFSGKAQKTWLSINQYILNNFCSPINPAHVASVFKLHPSYLSRLFNHRFSRLAQPANFSPKNFNVMQSI